MQKCIQSEIFHTNKCNTWELSGLKTKLENPGSQPNSYNMSVSAMS